eukprot:TRINITY_DN69966_c0_g1_i1.p1 TRINITY_DN69966_c0_g1~~TRINITY_DN69966_c0_g1_i1.p1  ORF type:complete len:926 (+),score=246.05 TRINITY_DN69966_c0_g1_i1:80-2857(+)
MGCGASGQQPATKSAERQQKQAVVVVRTEEDNSPSPTGKESRLRRGVSMRRGHRGSTTASSPLFQTWGEPPPLSSDGCLKQGEVLARGNFGSVTVAEWHLISVAVKEVKVNRRSTQTRNMLAASVSLRAPESPEETEEAAAAERRRLAGAAAALRSEIAVLSALMHPNVVQFLGERGKDKQAQGGDGGSGMQLIMECCPGGSLTSYLQRKSDGDETGAFAFGTPDSLALEVGEQMAVALHYLHSECFLHRDVRAANIFVQVEPPRGLFKLGDFGLVRDEDEFGTRPGSRRASVSSMQGGSDEMASSGHMSGDAANQEDPAEFPWPWTSPETLQSRVWTRKTDCWSLGVVLWEVGGLCERRPYVSDFPDGRAALERGEVLPQPEMLGDEVWQKVVLPCFQPEATRVRVGDVVGIIRGVTGGAPPPAPAAAEAAQPEFHRSGTDSSLASGGQRRRMRAVGTGGKAIDKEDIRVRETVTDRVKRASWRKCDVAAKECPRAEALLLRRIKHPHLVQYLGHAGPLIVTAWCKDGTLADYVRGRGADPPPPPDAWDRELRDLAKYDAAVRCIELDEAERMRPQALVRALRYAAQVAAALHYLHGNGVMHTAVRAANVYVDGSGTNCRLGSLSRCDAPSSCEAALVDASEEHEVPHEAVPDAADSWRYRAPEALENAADGGQKGDVWSVGVLVWEVLTGFAETPYGGFGSDEKAGDAIRAHTALEKPDFVDTWVWYEAVVPLFEPAPRRPTAGQAVLMLRYAHDALIAGGVEVVSESYASFDGLYVLERFRHGDRALWRQLVDRPGEEPAHHMWWSHKEGSWQIGRLGQPAVSVGPMSQWPWQQLWASDIVIYGHSREFLAAVVACDPAPMPIGGSANAVAEAGFPPPTEEELRARKAEELRRQRQLALEQQQQEEEVWEEDEQVEQYEGGW